MQTAVGALHRRIGLPLERIPGERRTLVLPKTVALLVEAGFSVSAEAGLGAGVGVEDAEYKAAGAEIVDREAAWGCPLVLKYKAPISDEYRFLYSGQRIAAIFHAEGDETLTTALVRAGVSAYSFEFFCDDGGTHPLMAAGGAIAGRQAVLYAAYYLQSNRGGRGVAMAPSPSGPRPKVVVIGSGNVGSSAARFATQLGGDVTVLCSSEEAARRYRAIAPEDVVVGVNSSQLLEQSVRDADVVIGAILISTFDTPAMVTEDLVRSMRQGSVLIDATAGYGSGYMPTFDRETTLDSPAFIKHGVVHIKIGNLPAAVPVSATAAVNDLFPKYLVPFARSVFDATAVDAVSRRGLIVEHGSIVHPELIRHAAAHRWMITQ